MIAVSRSKRFMAVLCLAVLAPFATEARAGEPPARISFVLPTFDGLFRQDVRAGAEEEISIFEDLHREGYPVILVDSNMPWPNKTTFVGSNNYHVPLARAGKGSAGFRGTCPPEQSGRNES